jgi:hypothetical protein
MEDLTPKKPEVENVTTAKTNSPTESDDSLLSDPPGYIAPDQQDIMLTDITSEILHSDICTMLIGRGDTYLSEAKSFPLEWPAFGRIFGNNKRLMISLPCRRARPDRGYKALNVFFLVDTGSPNSYLCQEAMTALIGIPDCTLPGLITMVVQNESFDVEFHLTPSGSHFHDTNVLGMDFLQVASVSMTVDTPVFLFRIFKSDRLSMLQDYPDEVTEYGLGVLKKDDDAE